MYGALGDQGEGKTEVGSGGFKTSEFLPVVEHPLRHTHEPLLKLIATVPLTTLIVGSTPARVRKVQVILFEWGHRKKEKEAEGGQESKETQTDEGGRQPPCCFLATILSNHLRSFF